MEELMGFVRAALAAGKSRGEISAVLAQAGWPADEVEEALGRYADVTFPVPVPIRRHSGSAREAFLYLVTFASLYASAIAFGALLFGVVDHLFPDPLAYDAGYQSDALRWNIATLIVAFPIYMLLTRMHLRSYLREPERRSSPVRRWLTYLTLFVAATVIIGTLIGLVGNILGGELAVPTLLKILVAMLLSAAVFAFYLWEMRSTDKETKR